MAQKLRDCDKRQRQRSNAAAGLLLESTVLPTWSLSRMAGFIFLPINSPSKAWRGFRNIRIGPRGVSDLELAQSAVLCYRAKMKSFPQDHDVWGSIGIEPLFVTKISPLFWTSIPASVNIGLRDLTMATKDGFIKRFT
jgi:hypothetical protein